MIDLPGNNNPSMVATILITADEINEWLKEHPVIESPEDAKTIKVFIDRGALGIQDMEDERIKEQQPHVEAVEAVRAKYRGPKQIIEATLGHAKARLAAYMRAEKEKREAIAAEAARVVAEAERQAREAERVEQDALGSVAAGELGVDVQATSLAADEAFSRFQRVAREAARAEKATKVKVGGGFRRAAGLRTETTLTVDDPATALLAVECTDEIREAIIKAAKSYHQKIGAWPPGVSATTSEVL